MCCSLFLAFLCLSNSLSLVVVVVVVVVFYFHSFFPLLVISSLKNINCERESTNTANQHPVWRHSFYSCVSACDMKMIFVVKQQQQQHQTKQLPIRMILKNITFVFVSHHPHPSTYNLCRPLNNFLFSLSSERALFCQLLSCFRARCLCVFLVHHLVVLISLRIYVLIFLEKWNRMVRERERSEEKSIKHTT